MVVVEAVEGAKVVSHPVRLRVCVSRRTYIQRTETGKTQSKPKYLAGLGTV